MVQDATPIEGGYMVRVKLFKAVKGKTK